MKLALLMALTLTLCWGTEAASKRVKRWVRPPYWSYWRDLAPQAPPPKKPFTPPKPFIPLKPLQPLHGLLPYQPPAIAYPYLPGMGGLQGDEGFWRGERLFWWW